MRTSVKTVERAVNGVDVPRASEFACVRARVVVGRSQGSSVAGHVGGCQGSRKHYQESGAGHVLTLRLAADGLVNRGTLPMPEPTGGAKATTIVTRPLFTGELHRIPAGLHAG
jgi:hypothetical protein